MSCINLEILMFFTLIIYSGKGCSCQKEVTPVYITPNTSIITQPKKIITIACKGSFSLYDKMRLIKRNPATNDLIILKENNFIWFNFKICVSSSFNGEEMYCDIKQPEKVLNETKPIKIIVVGDDDDYDDECYKGDEKTKMASTTTNTSLTTVIPTNDTNINGLQPSSPYMIGAVSTCLLSLLLFCCIFCYVIRYCRKTKNIVQTGEEPTYAVQYAELVLTPPQQDKPIIKDMPYAEITGVLVKKK